VYAAFDFKVVFLYLLVGFAFDMFLSEKKLMDKIFRKHIACLKKSLSLRCYLTRADVGK